MALMVTRPLPETLAEIHRVITPGGRLIATIPASGPLQPLDRAFAAGLYLALGRLPGYPNDRLIPHLTDLLRAAGLHVQTDESRRFGYPLHTPADADLLLGSLYLPGLRSGRLRLARRYLHALTHNHNPQVPIPIRRIVATPTT